MFCNVLAIYLYFILEDSVFRKKKKFEIESNAYLCFGMI